MTDPMTRNGAAATLCDLLAQAFSYPGPEFQRALNDGSFIATVATNVELLGNPGPLLPELDRLASGIRTLLEGSTYQQLESDYLALFELNSRQPPLHLNAQLYTAGKSDPAAVYGHLQRTYLDFGLELKPDRGGESPDHLTVQLEFLSYLYKLLGSMLRDQAPDAAAAVRGGIASFLAELSWVEQLIALLEERYQHPFYVPLGRFLRTLLRVPGVLPCAA